jgi:ankyrin repeat protein
MKLLELFHKKNADLNTTDKYGWSGLMHSIAYPDDGTNVPLIEKLLEYGVETNITSKPNSGNISETAMSLIKEKHENSKYAEIKEILEAK